MQQIVPKLPTKLESAYCRTAIIGALAVLIVAAAVCWGWMFDIGYLKRMLFHQLVIQSSTAIGLMLCALSLLLLSWPKADRQLVIAGKALAGIVAIGALLTFAEHMTQANFFLDFHLWDPPSDSKGLTFPGPMAPNVAIELFLISMALIMPNLTVGKRLVLCEVFALCVFLVSLMALIGHACGVFFLCTMFGCVRMSVTAAVLFSILSLALVLYKPNRGITAIFFAESVGGKLARRVLALSLVLPLLLWLRATGQSAGLYDWAFGWAFCGVIILAYAVAGIGWNAASLDSVNTAKEEAERRAVETSTNLNDLSELSRKERAVTDNVQEVICALDEQLKFVKSNPASLRLWGYAPEELIDKHVTGIVTLELKEHTVRSLLQAHTDSGSSVVVFENQINCKDGRRVDMAWSCFWSSTDKNFYCVCYDITSRKELDNLKQEFLAMISHELRTPLTSISASVKLALLGTLGKLPELAVEKLEKTDARIDRLIDLVNDLLDLDKLESGQMNLEIDSVWMKTVIDRSIDWVEEHARKQGVTIRSSPCTVEALADEKRLVQVMVNLLSNGIKFSPFGGVVEIACTSLGGFVEVRISDQGRGIPESYRQIIFDRFKQVMTSDGRRESGTGLGLPICKQIIGQHGGEIGVSSDEGKGSTFWFRVPLAATSDSSDAVTTPQIANNQLSGVRKK